MDIEDDKFYLMEGGDKEIRVKMEWNASPWLALVLFLAAWHCRLNLYIYKVSLLVVFQLLLKMAGGTFVLEIFSKIIFKIKYLKILLTTFIFDHHKTNPFSLGEVIYYFLTCTHIRTQARETKRGKHIYLWMSLKEIPLSLSTCLCRKVWWTQQ